VVPMVDIVSVVDIKQRLIFGCVPQYADLTNSDLFMLLIDTLELVNVAVILYVISLSEGVDSSTEVFVE
uniref:Secreted protein n=1 Tax=Parascaris univalens TaxID=6257 RepID=A0A915BLN2_PARUN